MRIRYPHILDVSAGGTVDKRWDAPASTARMAALLCMSFFALTCHADEDDVGRIPDSALNTDAAASLPEKSRLSGTVYGEVNAGHTSGRHGILQRMQNRVVGGNEKHLLVDSRLRWQFDDANSLEYSGRLSVLQTDQSVAGSQSARHDLRELFVESQRGNGETYRTGRVNLRNGVAVAFNPVDYFRSRTVVDTTTRNPAALRENRLGTAVLSGQWVGEKESASLAIAPRLAAPAGLASGNGVLNPHLAATNSKWRMLLKYSREFGADFNPDFYLAKEAGAGMQAGAALALSVGNHSTVYGEVSTGRRQNMTDTAIDFGLQSGDLPASVARLRDDAGYHTSNAAALGGTWSSEYQITVTIELDYSQAGWSNDQWNSWFARTSTASAQSQSAARVLQYIRDYSRVFQEPLSRRNVFLRVQWDNFAMRGLTASAFAKINPDDGSVLAQLEFDYKIDANQRLRVLGYTNRGKAASQYGSDLEKGSFLAGYSVYW